MMQLSMFWAICGALVASKAISDPILRRRSDPVEFEHALIAIVFIIPLWPIYVIVRFFVK